MLKTESWYSTTYNWSRFIYREPSEINDDVTSWRWWRQCKQYHTKRTTSDRAPRRAWNWYFNDFGLTAKKTSIFLNLTVSVIGLSAIPAVILKPLRFTSPLNFSNVSRPITAWTILQKGSWSHCSGILLCAATTRPWGMLVDTSDFKGSVWNFVSEVTLNCLVANAIPNWEI